MTAVLLAASQNSCVNEADGRGGGFMASGPSGPSAGHLYFGTTRAVRIMYIMSNNMSNNARQLDVAVVHFWEPPSVFLGTPGFGSPDRGCRRPERPAGHIQAFLGTLRATSSRPKSPNSN